MVGADAKGLLKAAIRDPNPVVFLENEILYGQSHEVPNHDDFVTAIWAVRRVEREGTDVTIVAYLDHGRQSDESRRRIRCTRVLMPRLSTCAPFVHWTFKRLPKA
jgi:pyruvate/2-oxoglutarate/acetoin dehydrogenase E1 component